MKKSIFNLALYLFASFGAFAQSTSDKIIHVTYPASVTPGETVTISVNYETTVKSWFRVVFGEAEKNSENYVDWTSTSGVNYWGKIGDIVQPTSGPTTQTLTFTVPVGVTNTSTAAKNGNVIKMSVWLLDDEYFDETIARSWHELNITNEYNRVVINNFSYPLEASIGEDITINYNYSNHTSESKTLNAVLVTAIKGGAVNWRLTSGYIETAAYLTSGDNVNGSFTLNLITTETISSSELNEGEEWRLVLILNDVQYTNGPEIKINWPDQTIIDYINITTLSSSIVDRNQIFTVNYEYSTSKDAIIQFSVYKFKDPYTPYGDGSLENPLIIVSDIVYVADIPASNVSGVFTQGVPIELEITANAIYSINLRDQDNYRVVAKLLHGTSTANSYVLETTKEVTISKVDALFGFTQANTFTAFPNPVSGEAVNFSTEISNVVVYDFTGNIVATEASATSLNTSNLKSGIYMISSDQGTLKVVVE